MTQFVLAIIISIVVLVFLIVKLNVHPVISLFVGGMLCGSILGNSPLTTITTIANGCSPWPERQPPGEWGGNTTPFRTDGWRAT